MYIGVDIGGSKILVVAGDARGKIKRSHKIETPDSAHQGVIEIIHLIEMVAAGEPIKAIGIGAAGLLDQKRGVFLENSNMQWEEVNLVKLLHNHFEVPVRLENDADTAALAEYETGAARNQSHVLYVTISTGIGIGIVSDGEIYRGAHDPEGGKMLIHSEGKMQMLEQAVAGPALVRRFGLQGFQIKDPKTWDEFSKDLAVGLYNFICVMSPSIIVIGGGVGVHFPKYETFLKRHLQELDPPYGTPPIVQAKHIETAVAHGALLVAARAAK